MPAMVAAIEMMYLGNYNMCISPLNYAVSEDGGWIIVVGRHLMDNTYLQSGGRRTALTGKSAKL